MKIILYKDVPDLGEEGDIKDVEDGFARNYLIPKKYAVRYTRATETELAQKQQAIARRKDEKVLMAASDKTKIEFLEMGISAPAGEKGRLFGSITAIAIANYLHSQDIPVERKRIEMPEAGIKTVGTHTVHIKLYGGDRAALKVNVMAEGAVSGEETPTVELPDAESSVSVELQDESPEADLPLTESSQEQFSSVEEPVGEETASLEAFIETEESSDDSEEV